MKIIVTGASGFIGSTFVGNNTNDEITCADLLLHDINSYDFTGNNVLLHCAALAHQMKAAPENEYFKVNSDLAFNVAQKSKDEKVGHFIFLSTIKVYGESTTNQSPLTEISECHPQDAYGKSKLDAEKRILSLEDKKFKVSIIRCPLVYGAGVKANMLNLISLIDLLPILPFGKIHNKRSFVYIGNLLSLINRVIQIGVSGIYIARDKDNISTTDLVIKISRSLNKKCLMISMPSMIRKLSSITLPSFYDRLWGSLEVDPVYGWNKIQFTPPFSVDQGIEVMVNWYLENIR